jgi:hypothetical protein
MGMCAILNGARHVHLAVLTLMRWLRDRYASPLDLPRSDCDGAASRDKGSGLVEIATGDEHENLVRERC